LVTLSRCPSLFSRKIETWYAMTLRIKDSGLKRFQTKEVRQKESNQTDVSLNTLIIKDVTLTDVSS